MEWTLPAKEELDKYLEGLKAAWKAAGADPSEAAEDIRLHVEEELTAAKVDIVTADDVRRVVVRLGRPEPPASEPVQETPGDGPELKPFNAFGSFVVLLAGVILPAVTLVIEAFTHVCAGAFFDPIPTLWHVVLVAFVPTTNFLVWSTLRRREKTHLPWLVWMNAASIGIAGFYTLLFIMLLPLAVIAVVFMGLGLLPLAPLCSFIVALILGLRLRKAVPLAWPKVLASLLIGVGALVAIELPSTVTRMAMGMAVSDSTKTSQRGYRWLWMMGNDDLMLRLCYQRPQRATDLVSFLLSLGDPVNPEEARKIYYRVHGVPFNSVPAPLFRRRGVNTWDPFDFMEFDTEQGGEAVGGIVKGLSLAGSRLDTSVDPDAALSYTEWVMEFENKSPRQAEARGQVLLPPDGFVSRLTLWINGEEREAAFAGIGKVREAYKKVVQARRDPVLVTTQGTDRVLVQCFPIPPNGGRMKVRLGITAPLVLRDMDRGDLYLPRFEERNFGVADELKHAVWVESELPLTTHLPYLFSENPKKGVHALRGETNDDGLGVPLSVSLKRGGMGSSWAPDNRTKGFVVSQNVVERKVRRAAPVMVIDDSRSLGGHKEALVSLIRGIEGVSDLIPASDPQVVLPMSTPKEREVAAGIMKTWSFSSGQDNVPALSRAWDVAAGREDGVILWIHGNQPVLLSSVENLKQKWERRPDGPSLASFQLGHGPNRILEQLDGMENVSLLRTPATSKSDDDALWRLPELIHGARMIQLVRARTKGSVGVGAKTSDHLVRLWAHDEILRLFHKGPKSASKETSDLAGTYQIVTPVSGAVVLETLEEHKKEGLNPADPATVPTIPEPEMYLLMAAVALLLLWNQRRKRAICGSR